MDREGGSGSTNGRLTSNPRRSGDPAVESNGSSTGGDGPMAPSHAYVCTWCRLGSWARLLAVPACCPALPTNDLDISTRACSTLAVTPFPHPFFPRRACNRSYCRPVLSVQDYTVPLCSLALIIHAVQTIIRSKGLAFLHPRARFGIVVNPSLRSTLHKLHTGAFPLPDCYAVIHQFCSDSTGWPPPRGRRGGFSSLAM